MKSKILPILILIFYCLETKAQDESKEPLSFSLYSELSSHFRGNRSNNLTLELSHGILKYALGFDHYYAIRANTRRYQPGSFNYLFTGRIGITPGRDWQDKLAFGLVLKYGKFHLLEAEGRDIRYSGEVYSKDFNKLVNMIFLQINTTFNHNYYFGFNAAGGFAHILNPVVQESTVPETSFGYGDYLLNDQLEFGVLNTEDLDPGPIPVIQLNFLCGYRF